MDNNIDKSVDEEEAVDWAQPDQTVGDEEEDELLPNGLPKNYNSLTKPGDPDGNDPANPVRVYADGVFDMFHVGHAKVLEQAKKLFKHVHLVVGVCSDEDVERFKGKYVMHLEERTDMVRHCKWTDDVISPAPWIIDIDFLKANNVHYVAHDDLPYVSAGSEDVYYDVKKAGYFRATQRTEGISTSDIINRILKDKDYYMERNLLRGHSSKEIGVSTPRLIKIKAKQQWKGFKQMIDPDNIKKLTAEIRFKRNVYDHAMGLLRAAENKTDEVYHKVVREVKKKKIEVQEKSYIKGIIDSIIQYWTG